MPETLAMSSLDTFVSRLSHDFSDFSFVEGKQFSWHAGKRRISFKRDNDTTHAIYSIIHELGHALLDHKDYDHDIELLQKEVAAWQRARAIAAKYTVVIPEDHIQDCLDTYRDWLHLRATCPNCYARSLQISRSQYRCHNCATQWQVSRSRLCRPYRLQTS